MGIGGCNQLQSAHLNTTLLTISKATFSSREVIAMTKVIALKFFDF